MNNELLKLWKEAESPVEYMIAAYIWFLFGLATTGWLSLVYLLLTEPSRFNNITFGIFDYV